VVSAPGNCLPAANCSCLRTKRITFSAVVDPVLQVHGGLLGCQLPRTWKTYCGRASLLGEHFGIINKVTRGPTKAAIAIL
jgi:hypothetical protein